MYVGAPEVSADLIQRLHSTSIFVDKMRSPYYASKFEYIIQKSNINDSYVIEEKVLAEISPKKMKHILGYSEEHPGHIHTEIDQALAHKLKLSLDFEHFDYSLRTELIH